MATTIIKVRIPENVKLKKKVYDVESFIREYKKIKFRKYFGIYEDVERDVKKDEVWL